MKPHYANTGQTVCHDSAGAEIPCSGSGQDAEFRPGAPWPDPRFPARGGSVRDRLTGLVWLRDANPAQFPLTWTEALDFASDLGKRAVEGRTDWRLPNRRELRSLISYGHRVPALVRGHPFENVFRGWYWTSTSAAINKAYAWYVHTEGGRMFYGHKSQSYLVWPVAGEGNGLLPSTGQRGCYDSGGLEIPCRGSGQDGESRRGATWPEPRLEAEKGMVRDNLTGLVWTANADLADGPLDWGSALKIAAGVGLAPPMGYGPWRLPTINELESLVDAGQYSPALPQGHPFSRVAETYCSSTTSSFETDWCMVLHLHKGAVGVGHKRSGSFHVWAVCSLG